jgi:phosphopantetheine--protein transferase-like protein
MIGTDIVEIKRIEKLLKKYSTQFSKKVFTTREIEYCLKSPKMSSSRFAARFAAKEAVSKVLSTGISGYWFTDIEIINNKHGKPEVFLHNNAINIMKNQNIKKIEISLSHSQDFAIAIAIGT